MKMTYNWLVAGMLAVATATPVLDMQARPSAHVQVCMTITDAMAYRILEDVSGTLEAQLQRPMSADFLLSEYHDGNLSISYLGHDGIVYSFQVTYGGGTLISSIEEI